MSGSQTLRRVTSENPVGTGRPAVQGSRPPTPGSTTTASLSILAALVLLNRYVPRNPHKAKLHLSQQEIKGKEMEINCRNKR